VAVAPYCPRVTCQADTKTKGPPFAEGGPFLSRIGHAAMLSEVEVAALLAAQS
jgi:hypothetical protein